MLALEKNNHGSGKEGSQKSHQETFQKYVKSVLGSGFSVSLSFELEGFWYNLHLNQEEGREENSYSALINISNSLDAVSAAAVLDIAISEIENKKTQSEIAQKFEAIATSFTDKQERFRMRKLFEIMLDLRLQMLCQKRYRGFIKNLKSYNYLSVERDFKGAVLNFLSCLTFEIHCKDAVLGLLEASKQEDVSLIKKALQCALASCDNVEFFTQNAFIACDMLHKLFLNDQDLSKEFNKTSGEEGDKDSANESEDSQDGNLSGRESEFSEEEAAKEKGDEKDDKKSEHAAKDHHTDALKNEMESESVITPVFSGADEKAFNYKVFTKQFDTTTHARKLAKPEELKQLKREFLAKLKGLKKPPQKDIQKILKKLKAQTIAKKTENLTYGYLDGRKLASLIASSSASSSTNEEMYYNITYDTKKNINVCILLDNSGSMRGKPILLSAIAALTLCKVLHDYKVNTEILGFTTSSWQGGSSRKIWQEKRTQPNPGRINDILHIIYKSYNESFARVYESLCVILKDGILKENIDGEALAWAHERLSTQLKKQWQQQNSRNILLIVSDGTPMDDATCTFNVKNYLELHLANTIKHLEKDRRTKLISIGINHDVSKFYKNSVVLNNVEQISSTMLNSIANLL